MKKIFILLLVFTIHPLNDASAQIPDPGAAVIQQAILFVRDSLLADGAIGNREIVLASEVLTDSYDMGPRHLNSILDSVRSVVDRVAPFESVRICPLNPRGRRNACELKADVLVQVGVPSVNGDSATVLVTVWTPSPATGEELNGSEISLVRRNGAWEVVGRKSTIRS